MPSDLDFLLFIAERGGLYSQVGASTSLIASALNCSQQSVSRKLAGLEANGLLERSTSFRGSSAQLTEKGRKLLKSYLDSLEKAFGSVPRFIEGRVRKGIGEGAYYVEQYQRFFRESLGFKAFPGTLNLEIDESNLNAFLDGLQGTEIKGFKTSSRTFGFLKCFRVSIDSSTAFLVIPERSRHPANIAELIASFCIRERLGLGDGSVLKIKKPLNGGRVK